MSGFDFKIDEGDSAYRVEMDLFDDTIREAFKRLARRQEEVLEGALKALGWMAPEDAEFLLTAVNQHDALVDLGRAVMFNVRGYQDGQCAAGEAMYALSVALERFDAQIGGN